MKMHNLHVKLENFSGGEGPSPPNCGVATAPVTRPHPLDAPALRAYGPKIRIVITGTNRRRPSPCALHFTRYPASWPRNHFPRTIDLPTSPAPRILHEPYLFTVRAHDEYHHAKLKQNVNRLS